MQLVTVGQIIDTLVESRKIASELFGIIIHEAVKSVPGYFGTVAHAIGSSDWTTAAASALLLLGACVVLYRLIRGNLFRTIKHLLQNLFGAE